MPLVILAFPQPTSVSRALRFCEPLEVQFALRAVDVPKLLDQAERWSAQGRHVAGWVSYEAAPAFDPAMRVRTVLPDDPPLAWFAAARDVEEVTLPEPTRGPLPDWTADESEAAYSTAVRTIREHIARGDVYQVNYSTRLRATVQDDALALLVRLSAAQRSTYAALFDVGTHRIISISPELFFERAGERIVTRPMKGTAPRGRWPAEDERLARELAASEKERAENVMIVDLLRNDLGRIANPGSVRVRRLFDIERYDTVWQMTSTVEATVPPDTSLRDCFAALFPCGSVTGAPKIAAMAAIAELESSSRGPYCGSIGYLAPRGRAVFSVAIRTLVQHTETGAAVYGAGGGITWDSDPNAEYREMLAKTRVLTREPRDFALLETMRLQHGIVQRAERHLARLHASAQHIGFAQPHRARTELERAARQAPGGVHRLRLMSDRDGAVRVEHEPFDWMPGEEPEPVVLASAPIDRLDPIRYHKTTHREIYDRFRGQARDAFDVLLWNDRGEATEFTFGNLVAEVKGRLVTPELDCGLLPGVMRSELLEAETIREAIIPVDSLGAATRLWLVNSLRGWVAVRLV